jgi:hypothetical protein
VTAPQSRHNQFFEHGDLSISYLAEMAKAGWTQRRMAAALGVDLKNITAALKRYEIEHVTKRGPRQ